MKIICHFGPHKTASTHLQNNLKLNRKLLRQHGIRYFRFHENRELQNLALALRKNINNKNFDLEKCTASIREIFKEKSQGVNVIVTSYEGILGELNHTDCKKIYPNAEKIIKAYAEKVFQNDTLIPIFASRNYDGLLRSTYKQALKYPSITATLDQYLSNKNPTGRRWTEISAALQDRFDGSLQFYTIEDYKEQWKPVFFKLITLTGKHINQKDFVFETRKRNVTGEDNLFDFYFTVNQYLSKTKLLRGLNVLLKAYCSSYFKETDHAKFLKSYQKKKELPPVNQFEDYWQEVQSLKEKYGI